MAQDIETFTPEESRLIWIDCEMTGLDIFHDELIEIAVVPTDFNLNILDKGIEMPIVPTQAGLDHMSDFVRKMHTDNGLLDLIEKEGVSLETAQKRMVEYVSRFLPEHGKAHMAGNTIGSDKKFLDHFMPDLMALMHYRTIDVSTLKEICRRWYPAVYVNKPVKHGGDRALADIIESIDEMRYYRSTMFVPQPGMDDTQAKAACEQIERTSLLRTYEQEGRVVSDPATAVKKDY